jgi:hypothetical protein
MKAMMLAAALLLAAPVVLADDERVNKSEMQKRRPHVVQSIHLCAGS